jgi:cation diffusion facilitator CzcD-associated flavoprotein CzcO
MGNQDVIIVGAGVVGLTLAHGLKAVSPNPTPGFEWWANNSSGWDSIPNLRT